MQNLPYADLITLIIQAQQSVPDGWSVAKWFDLNGWNRNILSDSIVTAVACQIKLSAQSICQAGFFAASLLFFFGGKG